MARPLGSRAQSPVLALIVAAVLLFTSQASAAVLGVDAGTQYLKAVLVKPGNPFDIVLTKDSRRKEAATIAFKPSTSGLQTVHAFPERLYGADASALAPRFPGDVYPNLKPLLGNLSDIQESVQAYRSRFPGIDLTQDEAAHSVSVKSSSVAGAEFSIEELVSMQLKNVKTNAETMAGKGHLTEDVVITVPAYYTAEERLSIQAAADMAGLNVLALVSDGLSVGLDYAMSRTFPNVDEGQSPEYHMIFDMGAGSTTSTILRFQARTIKDVGRRNKTIQEVTVLGTHWDRTLGGDALNQIILEDMVTKFVESKAARAANVVEAAVRTHGRTMAKLWREVEKARLTLSANQNTQASFESLYEDVDFKYKITRAEFEDMAEAYKARIDAPIAGALSAAELSWKDLSSVVLHGGVVRTPFVQKKLESLADDAAKLRSNVNADEAAVMGAAYKAASFSPSFRVKKEIKSFDSANYPASINFMSGDKARKQQVFVPTSIVGATKHITLNKLEDFELTITQTIPKGDIKDERAVFNVQATNVTTSVNELVKSYGCVKEDIQTQVIARLNPLTTLPEIVSGSVSCDSEQAEKKNMVDGVKNLLGFGGKKDQKPLKGDEPSEEASEEATSSAGSSSASAKPSAKTEKKAAEKDVPPRKTTHTVQLALTTTQVGGKQYRGSSLETLKQRLSEFDASDAGRRLREDFYNRLEAYTYRARDLLADETFIGASSNAQRDAIKALLASTSDWLYSDGSTATLEVIRGKLADLTDLVNPIKRRVEEASKRPEAVQAIQKALNSTEGVVRLVKSQIERAAESASSAAAAAAQAATESPGAKPRDGDEDDDDSLEGDATTSSAEPAYTPDPPLYTDAELSDISSLYDTVKEWLAEQIDAQSVLGPSDEPAFTVAELERRADQLSDANLRLLGKTPLKPKPKPKARPSSKKTKKAKTSKTSSGEGESATASPGAVADEAPAEPGAGEAQGEEGKTTTTRDEL